MTNVSEVEHEHGCPVHYHARGKCSCVAANASDDVDAVPMMTCPNCNGIGTTAGATYTWCSMCNKTGKASVTRPEQRVDVFKRNWLARYGFAPTETDIYNAGILAERGVPIAANAQAPVATVAWLNDMGTEQKLSFAPLVGAFEHRALGLLDAAPIASALPATPIGGEKS